MIDAEQIRNKCKMEIEALHMTREQEDRVIFELSLLAELLIDFYSRQTNNRIV